MKKTFTFTVMAALLIACGNKNADNAAAEENAEGTQEVAEVVEETPEVVELVTPDLTLCEVQGNVKTIDNGVTPTTTFDKEGNLLTYESRDKISHVKRNDKGQLTSFLGSDWMTVKWDGERPGEITDEMNGMVMVQKLTYDENGRVVAIEQVTTDEIEGDSSKQKITYVYTPDGIDAHGNWVKRTANFEGYPPETQTRKIEYYE